MRLNQSQRQRFGYVYQPQVNNKITQPTARRDTYNVMLSEFSQGGSGCCYQHQEGDGLFDIAKSIFQKGKKLVGKASDLYGSEIGKTVQNLLPSSDENARAGFTGEKHSLLQLPNGKLGVANYMGPGTHIIERLKRGDPPRTESDKVAQAHDIRYALASGVKSKEKQAQMIRDADQRMVNALDRISRAGTDDTKNIFIGKRLIQAKMLGEDAGVIPKGSFGGDLKNIPDDDRIMLMSKSAGLNQEGYGLPGQALKRKLAKQMKGKGLNPAGGGTTTRGGRLSKGKSYGTTKGYALKGGFLSLLAPLLGTVARSVGTALLGDVVGKFLGGNGLIGDITGKASKILKGKTVGAITKIIGDITHSDLPKNIVEKTGKALELIHQLSDNNKTKQDKMMLVAKTLLPHVKKAIATKMKGNGLNPAGGGMKTSDAKILKLINKDLSGGNIFNRRAGKSKMDFTKLNLKPMKPMTGGSKKMGINPKSMKGVKRMTRGGSLFSDAFTFLGEKPKYKR